MANRGGWLTQLPAGAVRQVHRRLEIVDASRVLAAQARRRRDADGKRQRTRCRRGGLRRTFRSDEHTSELQSLMRISYAVFCLKKKQKPTSANNTHHDRPPDN